jgi:hypothetical protein
MQARQLWTALLLGVQNLSYSVYIIDPWNIALATSLNDELVILEMGMSMMLISASYICLLFFFRGS